MVNSIQPFHPRMWEGASAKENDNEMSRLLQSKHAADQAARMQGVPQDDVKTSDQARVMASHVRHMEHAYHYSETVSLNLTTKEGDQVTLDFRQLYAEYQSYKSQQEGEVGPQGVRYFESREALEMTAFEERFAFSVEGDLNEDELGAIYDVFEQVDALATEFFDGDLEQALQKALDLNVDYSHLQSMSLNLSQTSMEVSRYQQEAAAQYEQMKGEVEEAVSEVANQGGDVFDLPPYLQQWQAVLARLEDQFMQAQTFFDRLMASVMGPRFPAEEVAPEVVAGSTAVDAAVAAQAQNMVAEEVVNPVEADETVAVPAAEEQGAVGSQSVSSQVWYTRVQSFHAELLAWAQTSDSVASGGEETSQNSAISASESAEVVDKED